MIIPSVKESIPCCNLYLSTFFLSARAICSSSVNSIVWCGVGISKLGRIPLVTDGTCGRIPWYTSKSSTSSWKTQRERKQRRFLKTHVDWNWVFLHSCAVTLTTFSGISYLRELKKLATQIWQHQDIGPVYMEVREPHVGEVTRLDGVTRLSM